MLTEVELSDGAKLQVSDSGCGPILLLVHGFPLDHTMWSKQIAELRSEFRIIAPDLRGFGDSDTVDGTLTMDRMAADLNELLDVLGVTEPVILCGLSMGGYIALRFLASYRDRLRAVVMCDTRAAADSEDGVKNRLRLARVVTELGPVAIVDGMLEKLFAAASLKDQSAMIEATRETIVSARPSSVAAAARGMAERPDSTSMLGSIDLPTLWICGVEDAITTLDEMRDIAAQTPGGQFVEIANAGHMAPLESPDEVNAAIRRFASALPA